MSKTSVICHVVFTTKHRRKAINPNYKRELYSVIFEMMKREKCWTYRINGMSDHIHMLFDLNPSVAMADLIKKIKWGSNKWLSNNVNFPNFDGWGKGYFAVSVTPTEKDNVIEYIKGQESHHSKGDFMAEIENLIKLYEMDWFPDDWD